MQRRTVPATPRSPEPSDHAVPSPEVVSTSPAGAPSGAAPTASVGLVPGAPPARPGRQRRGARVLAASAALVLALSACGGDEPPDNGLDGTMPDLSTSSDNGGTGDTAASDAGGDSGSENLAASIPAPDPADYPGMDQNTPEGAEQAFKYYIAVLTWAHQTGDTTTLSTLHSDECTNCIEFERHVSKAADKHLLWSEVEYTEGETEVYDSENFDHEIGFSFTLGRHEEPTEDYSSHVTVDPAETYAVGGLTWNESGWRVLAYSSHTEAI